MTPTQESLPANPNEKSLETVLDLALHEEEQLANRANWLDTKTGVLLGFVIVSVAELLGFLLLASAERMNFRTAHPHWLGVVFALGLLALTIAMFLGLGELFPMGFEYGASTEYLALEVDKEPKEIRAQCLASLRKTSVKNRSIVQKKAKLIKGTAIFVAAALLCYAVAVGLLFFSLLTPQVSVRTFQGLTAQIMFSVTLQPYS